MEIIKKFFRLFHKKTLIGFFLMTFIFMPVNLPDVIPIPIYLILKAIICFIPSVIFSFVVGVFLYFLNRLGIIQYFQNILKEVKDKQQNNNSKEDE